MNQQTQGKKQFYGAYAEFADVDSLMAAAQKVRKAGFQRWDCHTPFPVHGLDKAMGIRPTRLPWIVLAFGATGVAAALAMQYWMNGIDYPFDISGKPLFSWPAFIPVTFEMMVLFSAFSAFFAMWIINGLPKWFHPLFRKPEFARVTDDRFFVAIEARDPQFHPERTVEFLRGLGAVSVDVVEEPAESGGMPRKLVYGLVVLSAAAIVPPAMMFEARHGTTTKPPVNLVPDMDDQAKFRPQGFTPLFPDGRMSRPQPAGTVARGTLAFGDDVRQGMDGDRFLESPPAEVTVDRALLDRGEKRFDIYCAVCHGMDGRGEGPVAVRARDLAALGQATWVQPTDLTDDRIRAMPIGEIVHTIANGKNTMPSYGGQIPPRDRWAIALYVRALQKAQTR